jgi:hypothetical protein
MRALRRHAQVDRASINAGGYRPGEFASGIRAHIDERFRASCRADRPVTVANSLIYIVDLDVNVVVDMDVGADKG